MSDTKKPQCFAIAPIGPKDSDTRKRSDKVLRHLFKKALDEKYEVVRGDEIDAPGMITSQVLRAVQDAHLVVADLTEHNPNVLYELAVRHALEKPIIHVIEPRLSKIPFDIGGFRTIEFDLTDPDSIETAVGKLRKYAEQAEAGNWGETPIKLANIMRASKDDSPEILLLKQAVTGISNVAARLTMLETGSNIGSYLVQPGSLVNSYVVPSGSLAYKVNYNFANTDDFPASSGPPVKNAFAQIIASAPDTTVSMIGDEHSEKELPKKEPEHTFPVTDLRTSKE